MFLADFQAELIKVVGGRILLNEPLWRHTTWRIGGPADILVQAAGEGDIYHTVQLARQWEIPLTVIGNGSNLLVADAGVRGVVLKTARSFSGISREGERLKVDAGTMLPVVARRAADWGLSGLEWSAGIPATTGGAVVMNAGTPAGDMSGVVQFITGLDVCGKTVTLTKPDLQFGYRTSALQGRGLVVLTVELRLFKGDPVEIKDRLEKNLTLRKERQPLEWPSAGSVFRNPPGRAAGQLLEEAGVKGLTRGKARFSEKHANFIINLGGATAADVLWLIQQAKEKVYNRFGIVLETEICMVGEDHRTV